MTSLNGFVLVFSMTATTTHFASSSHCRSCSIRPRPCLRRCLMASTMSADTVLLDEQCVLTAQQAPATLDACEMMGDEEISIDDGVRDEALLAKAITLIDYPHTLPWVETLSITHSKPIVLEDINDDLTRELQFYNTALNAVQQAMNRMDQAKMPYRRPNDYFAEMVKSDDHMAKVKRKLLHENKAIEMVEQSKKQAAGMKFSKQVRANKLQERQRSKRNQLEAISAWKQNKSVNKLSGDSLEQAIADAGAAAQHSQHQPNHRNGKRQNTMSQSKSMKRQRKDSMYGGNKLKASNGHTNAKRGKFAKFGNNNNSLEDDGSKKHRTVSKTRPGKQRRMQSRASVRARQRN